MKLRLMATCAFGLEAVVKRELAVLGHADAASENGRLSFAGSADDLARCNVRLRCADRVFMVQAESTATDYDAYYDMIRALAWEDMLPEDARVLVTARSKSSPLSGVPRAQSVAKKAILDAMRRRYLRDRFDETGPQYHVDIIIEGERLLVCLDSSGPGLHKRGYRGGAGNAPLRETLAAALVLLSRWKPGNALADPLCGSGTIAIEAALIGRNIAPGLNRDFAGESWPFLPASAWNKARDEARSLINADRLGIYAADRDRRAFDFARENASRAGVADAITFEKKELKDFSSKEKQGWLITNPPYGERLGDEKEVQDIYRELGRAASRLDSWSLYILTAHQRFELYFGSKALRNRKLYNGQLKTYLYQY